MNDGLPLRDIHLPEPVSWWPPAPGWWLLLALLFAAGLGAWLRRRHHARYELRRQALEELERIENRFGRGDDELRILEELSVLLRRTAIARYPREQVASLTGQRWLRFLDGVMDGDGFSRGPGRALADAPYRPSVSGDDIPDLIDLCRRWLDAEFQRKNFTRSREAREVKENS